jgi:hypothetical protein
VWDCVGVSFNPDRIGGGIPITAVGPAIGMERGWEFIPSPGLIGQTNRCTRFGGEIHSSAGDTWVIRWARPLLSVYRSE